ncbi:MAG: cell division protease FtsH [Actinomycetota bacterium]|nr:cell division protease FtsH [Actinomycetota bacterium]
MTTQPGPWGRLLRSLRARFTGADPLLAGVALTLVVTLVAIVTTAALSRPRPAAESPADTTLTGLLADVRAGKVEAATLDETAHRVTVTHHGGPKAGAAATVPDAYVRDVVSAFVAAGVPLTVTDPAGTTGGMTAAPAAQRSRAGWVPAGIAVGGLVVLLGLLTALMVRSRRERVRGGAGATTGVSRGGLGVGGRAGSRGRGTVEPATVPTTRFRDVAGCDEAIADLTEMVMFLREPERFTRTGAKAPKGALLVGPPGTGKTLLARAVAGEAGVPFFAAAGSDFTEMYVGVGAKRVRELFAAARRHPRAILFIDEVDTVARRRSADGDQGAGETENTLVALLAEMDGFDDSNVIVLAATNRGDILDPALTRPGRLDRKVEVPNPDRRGRERILAVHIAGKPVAGDLDLTALARRTPGFSGAQLSALVNEACLEAARRDLVSVSHECFDHAVATVAMGRARTSALVTEHDREITAWHEAGHTLAAYLQADADDPVQVTIVPRGPAGGVTWMSGNDDLFLPRRKAHAQLVTALAGRAAEEVLLDGEYTQGAAGDLQTATELAFRMATQYGMTRLGYQVRHPRTATGDDTVSAVVEELLAGAHVAATTLLAEHREFLGAVAASLLDEETLTLPQITALARRCGVTGPATVAVPPPPGRTASETSAA